MSKPKGKIPNKIYFKIVEIGKPKGKRGWKWKSLQDKSGVFWGVFSTYRQAKAAIKEFRIKYKTTLEERGTYSHDEIFGEKGNK